MPVVSDYTYLGSKLENRTPNCHAVRPIGGSASHMQGAHHDDNLSREILKQFQGDDSLFTP